MWLERSLETEHSELIQKLSRRFNEPIITEKNAKYIFLLINIMHCGVTWKFFVHYLAALNADYQIINALIRHNRGDLQKHLA